MKIKEVLRKMYIARSLSKLQQHFSKITNYNGTARSLHVQNTLMAGHSKWANIKHIKAQKDGQKATLFTRLARQIRLAIQEGGGSTDPALNSQLRSVIDEALRKNMPMASIQNSIKKSQQSKAELKKCRLDMRYKQKVFLVCMLYTDNYPGLKMEITSMVKKAGGIFVDVGHMFEDFGLVETKFDANKLPAGKGLEEHATDDAIEFGAEEVEVVDAESGIINFICSPTHLSGLRKALEAKGYQIENSEHMFTANSLVQLSPDERKTYEQFLRRLRDVSGLEDIYDNVQMVES